jgi:hypothetical protein
MPRTAAVYTYRRTLARIQGSELDPGTIGGAGHDAPQRINLAHQVALADAANGRVAGHLADGFDVVGEQQGATTHARAGRRGLGTGVAAADDDHIVCSGVVHECTCVSGRSIIRKSADLPQPGRRNKKAAISRPRPSWIREFRFALREGS